MSKTMILQHHHAQDPPQALAAARMKIIRASRSQFNAKVKESELDNNEQASSSTTQRSVFSTRIQRRRYSPSAKVATLEYQPRGHPQASVSFRNTSEPKNIIRSQIHSRQTQTHHREIKLDQVHLDTNKQPPEHTKCKKETVRERKRSRSPQINALHTKTKANSFQIKGNFQNMRSALAHCVPSDRTRYRKLNSQLA